MGSENNNSENGQDYYKRENDSIHKELGEQCLLLDTGIQEDKQKWKYWRRDTALVQWFVVFKIEIKKRKKRL